MRETEFEVYITDSGDALLFHVGETWYEVVEKIEVLSESEKEYVKKLSTEAVVEI